MSLFDDKPKLPEFCLFRDAREHMGLTADEIADELDTEHERYQYFETHPGKLGMYEIFYLCDRLNIDYEDFQDSIAAYLATLDELGLVPPIDS